MADPNTVLIILGFLLLVYLLVNNQKAPVVIAAQPQADGAKFIDRTGSDWNQSGTIVEQVGLDRGQPTPPGVPDAPFVKDSDTVIYKGTVAPWTDDKEKDGSVGGPGWRDSYSQYKMQDELYPNYYNKYEVFTSDYYPWWRNQHFWPYYTRSHNWLYRYPYYSYWRRPYYYNYWASPYYPSRAVLVKPYLRTMSRKQKLQNELESQFRRSKIDNSPVST